MECGADMCVQSIHKTAGALGQSSMLHAGRKLCEVFRTKDSVNLYENPVISNIEASLKTVQSTSPSYLLMSSLDAARRQLALNADRMAENALRLAGAARSRINSIPGIICAGTELTGTCGVFAQDLTRLMISACSIGIGGYELKRMLFEDFDIDVEMADERSILALVSYANTEEDTDALCSALECIAKDRAFIYENTDPQRGLNTLQDADKVRSSHIPLPTVPEQVLTPRQAFFAKKKRIPWKECAGMISAEIIAPYPPGIPVLCPGERISREILDYVGAVLAGKGHMQGPSDPELNTVLTAEDPLLR